MPQRHPQLSAAASPTGTDPAVALDEARFTRISVVFADRHVVVVDKPAGVPSVPARTAADPPCVTERIAAEWGPLEAAHRLDRDTSGLLVLARTREARAHLGRAFEARAVRKRYLAIVGGLPGSQAGVLHMPLAADPWRPPRQMVDPICGRAATTWWRELARRDGPQGWSSLLDVEPVTGRSQQIRAHLAWLGMPIVGDRLYGGRVPVGRGGRGAVDGVPGNIAGGGRMALHALSIAFPHPADSRPIELTAPVVADGDGDPWRLFAADLAVKDR